MLKGLLEPFESLLGELVLLAVVAEVLDELRKDRLELLESGRHDGGSGSEAQRGYRGRGVEGESQWDDGLANQDTAMTCRAQ